MSTPVGPVIYAVYVNEVLITDFPLDTELRQEWGKHDMMFFRIEYPRTFIRFSQMKLWPDNAPIRVIWGRKPSNIETWYGYVNHHNVSGNADSGSKAIQVTYTCIGTSKPMNTDKNRTWGEVTPTYIARTIAQEHGMRAVLTKTNWVLPYEVQGNESDFHFLNRIGEKVGFRFWVSGGTLYYIDPAVVLDGINKQSVASFRLDKMFTQVDTVRQFSLDEGDNLPGAAVTSRSIYGVDENSGTIFQLSANQGSSVSEIKTDSHVTSLNEAGNLIAAWQSLSQWWISAKAELFGTAALYPGKLVYLDGLQMPQNSKGYWIVSAATHVLKSSGTTYSVDDKFVSQVQLLRNTGGTIPNIKGYNNVSPEFIACTLQGSKWQATSMATLYDGVMSV
jgi:phage protein D